MAKLTGPLLEKFLRVAKLGPPLRHAITATSPACYRPALPHIDFTSYATCPWKPPVLVSQLLRDIWIDTPEGPLHVGIRFGEN